MLRPQFDSWESFQPSQIICLTHEGSSLYAEVVQVVPERQVCWARPLMLLPEVESSHIYDLRQGPDLLLPARLFRPALDVEVIPLLTRLQTHKTTASETIEGKTAHQRLSQFIRKVCQEHPAMTQA